MKKTINKALLIIAVMATITGCKDYLDINTDPNNPSIVSINQLLPAVLTNVAFSTGNAGGLNGHVATVMHQTVQRGGLNDYNVQSNDFNIGVTWNSLYSGALTDIRQIIALGTESEDWHYVGIAQINKAYIYSVIVDVWGDVPYFDANLGSENPFPGYDGGADIYADLQLLLDEGIANLAKSSNLSPSTDDFVYGGDLNKWRKLGKSLKFKLYAQTRLVANVSSELNALLAENDMIANADQDFEFAYGTSQSPENRNPGYVQEWAPGGSNYYISPYFFEVMRSIDTFGHGGLNVGPTDPRVPYYFFNQLPSTAGDSDAQNPCSYCPSTSGNGFLSIYAFSFNIDPNEGFDQSSSQSVLGLYPVGGKYDDGAGGLASLNSSLAGQVNGTGTVAQRMLPSFEIMYLRAELALAGVTSEDPRAMLVNAMDASFAKVNEVANNAGAPLIDGAAITTYQNAVLAMYDGGSADLQMEIIMTQKWIASFGNALSIYNDYRRTGYPRLHDGNTDALSITVQGRSFPVSFPYTNGEITTNPNAPAQRVIATDKVFWDN